jgi:hypothetical protein
VTSGGRAASAARFSRFANAWQIRAIFAKHWQNALGSERGARASGAPQSNGPNGPLPMFGKFQGFLPMFGKTSRAR